MRHLEDSRVLSFVNAVRSFRDVLEKKDCRNERATLLSSLAGMCASVYSWPWEFSTWPEGGDALAVREFEIAEDVVEALDARLRSQFGEEDRYWMHWEPLDTSKTGEPGKDNFSAGLTQIYAEVLPPLRAWETGDNVWRQYALHEWRIRAFGWMLILGHAFPALAEFAGPPPC